MDTPTQDATRAVSFTDLGVGQDLVDVLGGSGITEPFPIQEMTIRDALAGRDVCGKAQTGSGKTLAFGLPLIEGICPDAANGPFALVLVPTRELCNQVATELTPLADRRGLRLVPVYGGTPMKRQITDVERGADVLVATPGRLIDLIERRVAKVTNVSLVVLDEADQMADMGFLPQVHRIMREIGGHDQTMLFSATLDGQVGTLVKRYLADPIRHEVEDAGEVVDTQEHRFLLVHHMDKAKVAATITESAYRTLVFVRTKRGADRVADRLKKEGVNAAAIHGDMRQRDRERTLARFTSGDLPVLVATDLASRGLHIEEIDIVMHYDPPESYKSFIHRSGRTARAGESGLVVTLVEWDQVQEVQRLQKASGLHYEIVKVFSNDELLSDLSSFEPETVELKMTSDVDLSRRMSYGRRRRRR